jgi:hypothetical protein
VITSTLEKRIFNPADKGGLLQTKAGNRLPLYMTTKAPQPRNPQSTNTCKCSRLKDFSLVLAIATGTRKAKVTN